MKCLSILAVSLVATATALSIARPDQVALGVTSEVEKYLIELSPGETRWVTEDEKWALRRVHTVLDELSPVSTLTFHLGGPQLHGHH